MGKLSIFQLSIPKLPAPKEEDLSKGLLESIDMDSHRVEVRSAIAVELADQNAEIEPVPTSGGRMPEPELIPEQHFTHVQRSIRQHRLERC